MCNACIVIAAIWRLECSANPVKKRQKKVVSHQMFTNKTRSTDHTVTT